MPPGVGDRLRHISLFGLCFDCAICGQHLDPIESMVALVGNVSSSAFKTGFINPFPWNEAEGRYPDFKAQFGPWEICRARGIECIKYHDHSRPGCAVHPDCLQVYMRNCTADDALDRLWQACVWRRLPWTGSRVCDTPMLPRPVWRFADAFLRCAERCGLPRLDGLPQLVIEAIMESLPQHHYFWRCVTALDMARRLSSVRAQPLLIVQLSRLLSWERGTPPKVASEEEAVANLPPFVRLTIDVDGLCKVERLKERPRFSRRRFDDRTFVIERIDDLGVSLAMFKNGLVQLSLLEDTEEIKFAAWDTPTPPDLSRCLVKPKKPLSMHRYHTIDLAAATGLTFFISAQRLLAIHAHTRAYPSAMATYRTLQDVVTRDLKFCLWVYVPLPQGDVVLSCGSVADQDIPSRTTHRPGGRPCFLIRMRLSGETVVGQYAGEHEFDDDSGERDDSATSLFLINRPEHPPKTLVYRTEANWPRACIFFLVAYSEQGLRRTTERPWHSPPPHPYPFWYRHSHAPLGEVRQVRVFYRPDTKTCMGMLLDYDNGGQRAVGQCRLHVDPSRTFPRPSFVAFLNLPEYGEGVRVLFGDLPSLDEDEHGDSWCYFAMAGTLDFWFGPDAAAVSVREGKPIPWETLLKKHG